MNEKDVADNMGSCGRACKLCTQANFCDGCHSRTPQMARWQEREGCFQYICCKRKKFAGCWECEEAPCDKDMFLKEMSLRVFVTYAKNEGIQQLGTNLFHNQIRGIVFPKAYTKLTNEADVTELLCKNKPKVKG